jgi:hypothetical protein
MKTFRPITWTYYLRIRAVGAHHRRACIVARSRARRSRLLREATPAAIFDQERQDPLLGNEDNLDLASTQGRRSRVKRRLDHFVKVFNGVRAADG